jgi:outer membrane autotransporter protein
VGRGRWRSTACLWAGHWADFDDNKNAASADRNLGGFVSGMDAHVTGSWRLGVATGASFSDISVDARRPDRLRPDNAVKGRFTWPF